MQRFLCLIATALLAACATVREAPTAEGEHRLVVRRFVDAFNAHDVDAMAALITHDAQWLSVDADKIKLEAGSRAAIRASMSNYFSSCPSCQSQVTDITMTANRVSTVETASWQTPMGLKSQRGFAIYEFEGSLIKRVYYFPVER